jgi:hypothetical protein
VGLDCKLLYCNPCKFDDFLLIVTWTLVRIQRSNGRVEKEKGVEGCK